MRSLRSILLLCTVSFALIMAAIAYLAFRSPKAPPHPQPLSPQLHLVTEADRGRMLRVHTGDLLLVRLRYQPEYYHGWLWLSPHSPPDGWTVSDRTPQPIHVFGEGIPDVPPDYQLGDAVHSLIVLRISDPIPDGIPCVCRLRSKESMRHDIDFDFWVRTHD